MSGASVKADSSKNEFIEIFGGGSEGTHYFLCTIGDHCERGQKLAVKVVPAGDPSLPKDDTPEPSSGGASMDLGLIGGIAIAVILLGCGGVYCWRKK